MRHIFFVGPAALVLLAAAAVCEPVPLERVPDEAVRSGAVRLAGLISKAFPDAPVKVTGNAEKAVAYKREGVVLLAVPDGGLAKKTLDEAGDQVSPVGWIVLRGLAPEVDGGI